MVARRRPLPGVLGVLPGCTRGLGLWVGTGDRELLIGLADTLVPTACGEVTAWGDTCVKVARRPPAERILRGEVMPVTDAPPRGDKQGTGAGFSVKGARAEPTELSGDSCGGRGFIFLKGVCGLDRMGVWCGFIGLDGVNGLFLGGRGDLFSTRFRIGDLGVLTRPLTSLDLTDDTLCADDLPFCPGCCCFSGKLCIDDCFPCMAGRLFGGPLVPSSLGADKLRRGRPLRMGDFPREATLGLEFVCTGEFPCKEATL